VLTKRGVLLVRSATHCGGECSFSTRNQTEVERQKKPRQEERMRRERTKRRGKVNIALRLEGLRLARNTGGCKEGGKKFVAAGG